MTSTPICPLCGRRSDKSAWLTDAILVAVGRHGRFPNRIYGSKRPNRMSQCSKPDFPFPADARLPLSAIRFVGLLTAVSQPARHYCLSRLTRFSPLKPPNTPPAPPWSLSPNLTAHLPQRCHCLRTSERPKKASVTSTVEPSRPHHKR